MAGNILIADDDKNICEMLRLYLESTGYGVFVVYDGMSAINMFDEKKPDLAILDIMMPKADGIAVCRAIRKKSSIPVIMLTAKGDVDSKVEGLEIGADDYVVKPFEPKELIARVRSVLRRTSGKEEEKEAVKIEGLSINKEEHIVKFMGEEIDMPLKELELIYFLVKNRNRVFTREELLKAVWGYDYWGDSRTVDVHVKRIREKIKDDRLKTVWGVGYKFEVKDV